MMQGVWDEVLVLVDRDLVFPAWLENLAQENGLPEIVGQAVGDKERWLFVAGTMVWLEGFFWFWNAVYYLVMASGWFERYRIEKSQPYPESAMVKKAVEEVVLDHFVARPLLLFFVFPYAKQLFSFDATLPSMQTVIWQFLVCMQVDDFWFYWSHRLAHHKWFYWAHKQHHEFHHPIPIATEYASIFENIFVNTIGTILGPMLLRSHVTTFWFYVSAKLYQSIDAHSGYALPFPLSPWTIEFLGMDCARAHDYHHSGFQKNNFGGYFRFWDWLCGTDLKYREARKKTTKVL